LVVSVDLMPLFNIISSNVDYVLLGEASHGTSDFYKWRTEITKYLISNEAFSFIAVEGDWLTVMLLIVMSKD
jgi:erythromycin esterase